MSEFDPDNRAGAGGGAGFQTIQQGGNVSSRLPGRNVTTGGEAGVGSGTTTVNDLRGQAQPKAGGEGELPIPGTFDAIQQRGGKAMEHIGDGKWVEFKR